MIRRIRFDASSAHKIYYRLLWESFYSRGSAVPDRATGAPPRVSKEEKRSDGKILRALKAVGRPVGPEPQEGELDGRFRTLSPEGGVMDMEQPEFKRLQSYVDDMQWQSAFTDVASDLEDWLDATPKVEPVV